MATVNFLYRSKKSEAPLNVRLLFRHNEKDLVLGGKTRIVVSRDYWTNFHPKQRVRDIAIKNQQVEVNAKLTELESFILKKFHSVPTMQIGKNWLNDIIKSFYSPATSETELPNDLLTYIDYYLEYRKNEISESNRKKVNVLKNKMVRLQRYLGETIFIRDIHEDFKKAYVDFSLENNYSQNTQQRELVLIKTICFHARHLGLPTHHQLDGLKLKREEIDHIYLTPEDLVRIQDVQLDLEHLENARDWLLVSCYTGQRISDFMRFNSSMIRLEKGKHLLEFRQKKTKKLMSIPLTKEVRFLLEKRNGKFPRPISDQRYNEYIKEVCREAEITEKVKGKKRVCIAPEGVEPTKNDYRDVMGTFPKWELVTSHIGRRSFATNNYGKVPTTLLINITGHGSEKMFLNYIKKSNKDLALEAWNYFN